MNKNKNRKMKEVIGMNKIINKKIKEIKNINPKIEVTFYALLEKRLYNTNGTESDCTVELCANNIMLRFVMDLLNDDKDLLNPIQVEEERVVFSSTNLEKLDEIMTKIHCILSDFMINVKSERTVTPGEDNIIFDYSYELFII